MDVFDTLLVGSALLAVILVVLLIVLVVKKQQAQAQPKTHPPKERKSVKNNLKKIRDQVEGE